MQPVAQAVGKWGTEKPRRGERFVLIHTPLSLTIGNLAAIDALIRCR
jgi:hypothetical protein